MRLLICGDRDWQDIHFIRDLMRDLPQGTVVIHGAARGADKMAGQIAQEMGLTVESYPANWAVHGRAAGPIRNRQMLREGKPTHVWAFHDNIHNSKGTKDMLELAKAHKLIWSHYYHAPRRNGQDS